MDFLRDWLNDNVPDGRKGEVTELTVKTGIQSAVDNLVTLYVKQAQGDIVRESTITSAEHALRPAIRMANKLRDKNDQLDPVDAANRIIDKIEDAMAPRHHGIRGVE